MAEKSMNRFNYHETDDGDGEGGGRVMKVCRSKGAEQHPDHVDRHHGDRGCRDPSALVVVCLDLEHGHAVAESQHEQNCRVRVEQHKPDPTDPARWIGRLQILFNLDGRVGDVPLR